ncbi:hypothetical protein [Pedobacter sp. MR2016-24]|uniref:hypothetical protein n=1 Tax=Pedobacter sp. MR2016-24 TaxID=2994466 RepID=UPI002248426F|nr:hypothetical protein [Pedobacter sp. MR2016-24]MCX2483503.1 hypothetical protein [Pedobacter sp. MR2016-24]
MLRNLNRLPAKRYFTPIFLVLNCILLIVALFNSNYWFPVISILLSRLVMLLHVNNRRKAIDRLKNNFCTPLIKPTNYTGPETASPERLKAMKLRRYRLTKSNKLRMENHPLN